MFVSFLSPLAPAAILLLSAFILFIMPRVPLPRRYDPWLPYFLAPGLVGVAILSLLVTQLTLDGLVAWDDLTTKLVDWPLSAEAIALEFQADSLSFPFLLLILLLLLAIALVPSPFSHSENTPSLGPVSPSTLRPGSGEPSLGPVSDRAREQVARSGDRPQPKGSFGSLPDSGRAGEGSAPNWRTTSGWLLVGAGLCLVAVSANLVVLSAAIMVSDLLLMAYWLKQHHQALAISRLFLGVLSAGAIALQGALVLSENTTVTANSFGLLLMGIALWLRLGLLPFIEITEKSRRDEAESPLYLALSLVMGLILLGRILDQPLPVSVLWLTALVMLLSGLLAWLTDRLPVQLFYLLVVETLLLLLAGPLPGSIVAAAGLMLILSLLALWLTPRLGRPNFSERAGVWPYLPAGAATLTLVGLPLFIGWPVRLVVYEALISLDSLSIILLAILAEMLALSSLVGFWQGVWSGQQKDTHQNRLMSGLIVMVPFLLPGLGSLVFERITRLSLPTATAERSGLVLALMLVIIIGAVSLQVYRENLLAQLKISPSVLVEFAQLRWLWPQSAYWLRRLGQLFLRVEVIFEGQHYLGWAIFATIIGALIILLRV